MHTGNMGTQQVSPAAPSNTLSLRNESDHRQARLLQKRTKMSASTVATTRHNKDRTRHSVTANGHSMTTALNKTIRRYHKNRLSVTDVGLLSGDADLSKESAAPASFFFFDLPLRLLPDGNNVSVSSSNDFPEEDEGAAELLFHSPSSNQLLSFVRELYR
jgi:hypothetical protein